MICTLRTCPIAAHFHPMNT